LRKTRRYEDLLASSEIKHVVITGATGSIGGALARAYARQLGPRGKLTLQGRQTDELRRLVADCEQYGGKVATVVLDLGDRAGLSKWCNELGTQQVDLLIANAGIVIHTGLTREGEAAEAVDALIEINIRATMHLVNRVLPQMRARRAGQIALISSLAGYYGLPISPSYSASKAALKAYGEGLRAFVAPDNVRVNVVMPGFVATRLSAQLPTPKPFTLTPEDAAHRIMRGLDANQARIAFPFPLSWATWSLAVLPASLVQWLLRVAGFKF
jgi:short-subunit dehydrogenase